MKTIYLVPHTHYDVAWAFTKEDYLQINELIYTKATELMKSSEFKFLMEQVYLLKAIEEKNHQLWSELKSMIAAGKLEIVDGQYCMPDAMLPAGEVLVREILFGKRYVKEKFGVEVPVAWASDTFGLNAQMPQIYKKSGYKWLAFRRGLGESVGSRTSEFLWRGLDGTSLLSHWFPRGYRAGLDLTKLDRAFNILSRVAATQHVLIPSGSGVTIPQEETVDAAKNWNRTHKDSFLKIATPSEFFMALEKEGREFEVVDGEMYDGHVEEVFPDVCSSRMWITLGNRKYERLIVVAEELATIAWLSGKPYPAEVIRQNWEKLLFIAFHDIIAGCGIDEIYREVKEYFDSMEQELGSIVRDSKGYVVGESKNGSHRLVVFNCLPWPVMDWVEVELDVKSGDIREPGLRDNNNEIETQILELERGQDGSFTRARLGFMAEVPPLGYKLYDIVERAVSYKRIIEVSENEVSTPFFNLRVDDGTGIVEVCDKGGKLLVKGNELIIEDEVGDLYFHHSRLDRPIHTEGGGGLAYGDFKPVAFNIEQGGLRVKVTLEEEYYSLRWPYRLLDKYKPRVYSHRSIEISKEVIAYRDIPRIDFVTRVNNKHPDVRIMSKFDTGIMQPEYFRETQFGVIREPGKFISDVSFKVPFLSWVDCGSEDRGVTFLSRGAPMNEMGEGYIYLTLLRSVSVLSADGESGPFIPTPDATEIRAYTYEYALYPHPNTWKESKSFRVASTFNHPLIASQMCIGDEVPRERSFMELRPDNILLTAVKKAEDGSGVVIRLYETKGEKTRASLDLAWEISKACHLNLLEEEVAEVGFDKKHLELDVEPFEIVTLKLDLNAQTSQ